MPNPNDRYARGYEAGSSHPFVTPPAENFDTETMRGSVQEIVADNIGVYAVCEFLLGTGPALARKQGFLHSAGRSYFTLYDDRCNRYVMCDVFSVKFITFYPPGQRPAGNSGGCP